jgi:hypothetical protein
MRALLILLLMTSSAHADPDPARTRALVLSELKLESFRHCHDDEFEAAYCRILDADELAAWQQVRRRQLVRVSRPGDDERAFVRELARAIKKTPR